MKLILANDEFKQVYKPNTLKKSFGKFSFINEDCSKVYIKYVREKEVVYEALLVKKLNDNNVMLRFTKITPEEINCLEGVIEGKPPGILSQAVKNSPEPEDPTFDFFGLNPHAVSLNKI